jgi:DNA topoisomerase-1
MQQAKYETISVKIQGGEYYFTVSASKLKFDGFMAVYTQEDDAKSENQFLMKSLRLTAFRSSSTLHSLRHIIQRRLL